MWGIASPSQNHVGPMISAGERRRRFLIIERDRRTSVPLFADEVAWGKKGRLRFNSVQAAYSWQFPYPGKPILRDYHPLMKTCQASGSGDPGQLGALGLHRRGSTAPLADVFVRRSLIAYRRRLTDSSPLGAGD
jgi:hypothetical protein